MEHIKNIEIKNFKSIRHAEIKDCRRVNVFIGYPNVGKSNILEALGLFSSVQSKNQIFNFNEICRVKHFSELFFNQDFKETNNVIINDRVKVELITNLANNLELRIHILTERNPSDRFWEPVFTTTVSSNNFTFGTSGNSNESDYKQIVAPIKKYEFRKDVFINKQNPQYLAIPNGNNLLDILQRNKDLRKEIVNIFSNYGLKLVLDRVDESIKFQKELDDGTVVSIPYHQVADTLKRLIFYKAAIQTNTDSILLFEEPESHMFPPYMRKFTADVIFDKTNQFFIATHSPYVLGEFIEEIKDELSVYVVDYNKGETIIKRLSSDEVTEISQYGIDLFFNLESYLDRYGQPRSA